jgi:NADP-dependent 3-hydroxy acid dehydrogenase YdfG
VIDLRDRPILITGASSGIGRATAIACAKAGMPVVAGARRIDRLHAVVDEIKQAGGRAIAVACDVDRPEQCSAMVKACVESFGTPYAVFANAGYGVERPLHAMSDHELRAIFETNVWGTMNIVRPAVDEFLRIGRGHVLMCASCLSKLALPYGGAYSATKACQDHFARAMRLELEGRGIHVSSVHPIGTQTEFFEQVEVRTGQPTLSNRTPGRSLQPPQRVADAIVRCLRRPHAEVWTSLPARLGFSFIGAFPGLADRIIRRYVRSRKHRAERSGK